MRMDTRTRVPLRCGAAPLTSVKAEEAPLTLSLRVGRPPGLVSSRPMMIGAGCAVLSLTPARPAQVNCSK